MYHASKDKAIQRERGQYAEGLPEVIVELVSDISLSIADSNTKEFVDNYVKEIQEKKIQTNQVEFHLKASNILVFDFLRLKLKEGEITDLKLSFDGQLYDMVLPNGRLTTDSMPFVIKKSIFLYKEFLLDII